MSEFQFFQLEKRLGKGISLKSSSLLNHMNHSLVSMAHELHGLLTRRCILEITQDLTLYERPVYLSLADSLTYHDFKSEISNVCLHWTSPNYVCPAPSTHKTNFLLFLEERKMYLGVESWRTNIPKEETLNDGRVFIFLKHLQISFYHCHLVLFNGQRGWLEDRAS